MAYIGDDWNDLQAMMLTGFKACPSDATDEIKHVADYISIYAGGHGAVRDCLKTLLIKCGRWENITILR